MKIHTELTRRTRRWRAWVPASADGPRYTATGRTKCEAIGNLLLALYRAGEVELDAGGRFETTAEVIERRPGGEGGAR